jgi:hypothetical protein
LRRCGEIWCFGSAARSAVTPSVNPKIEEGYDVARFREVLFVAVAEGASSHWRHPLKRWEVVVFSSSVRVLCLAGSLASLAVLPVGAQEKGTREKAAGNVPQSAQPPAGLCRVWLENVPASQQPAPTDCATAIKNRPNNARVVFGNLKDEAAKPPQRGTSAPQGTRTNRWPNRQADQPHRFDTGPGFPSRQGESRQGGRPNEGANGVRPVNSTMPAVRPSADSGRKRRP